jgi:ribosome biogenesis ATPase
MVRPGRLDKLLYVDLPTPDERVEILRAQTRGTPLGPDVDLGIVGRDEGCDGFSGADLSALVREAAVAALKEVFSLDEEMPSTSLEEESESIARRKEEDSKELVVEMRHFREAVHRTNPSVSGSQRRRFEVLRAKFAGMPVGRGKEGRKESGGVGGEREEGEATLT